MAQISKLKSGSILEEKESFSRAVVVDNWIFMSLTSGRDYKSRVMPDTAVGQAENALRNVEGALKAVGSQLSDVVRSRIFIPDQADVPAVMAFIGERFRGIDHAHCVTCSPLGGPEYLFEIEVTAYKGAGSGPQERMVISL
ncbi:RidA family protein [Pseudomonas sp. HR96]|uniref:RidA family protein n=1 Tax=Pseudomonas sp. HR96 TaxID=1027966 RepID=UPI002A74C0F0|nr:RidA family protein [Pseudomonas sp. HR96]WPO97823.1 RidA family protein [Pseudomonas sp. HR96]